MSPTNSFKSTRHSLWIDMIKECAAHADLPHGGISRPQIKKYVQEAYNLKIGPAQASQLSKAIALGEENGIFVLPKGLCGNVKLAPGSSRATGAYALPGPFKFPFSKERGAFDLSGANGFVSLLEDIRSHLLRSQSTRAIYVNMVKKFFFASANDVKAICAEPTDDDFLSYVHSHWPTFRSCKRLKEEDGLSWGWVMKKERQKMNDINILADVVEAEHLAAAGVARYLPSELYQLIITAIVLHELAHSFTKFYFHDNDTPFGVGVDGGNRKCGESGWLVEEQIMGGRLVVEWAPEQDSGNVFCIDHVLLENGSKCWKLDVNIAKTSLSSLRHAVFVQPAQERHHIRLPGSFRARATQLDNLPSVPVEPSVGLGISYPGPFRSFIGEHRRA